MKLALEHAVGFGSETRRGSLICLLASGLALVGVSETLGAESLSQQLS